jgi:hypothetical protein
MIEPRRGHGAMANPLSATTTPACHPGARPPAGGWIDSASRPLIDTIHAITEFEFHISPAASFVASPDRARNPWDGLKYSSGAALVIAEAPGAIYGLGHVGDMPAAPKPDLIAEDPKPGRESAAHGALGDDAAPVAAQVRNGRLLDHVGFRADSNLQRRVVEVLRGPAL